MDHLQPAYNKKRHASRTHASRKMKRMNRNNYAQEATKWIPYMLTTNIHMCCIKCYAWCWFQVEKNKKKREKKKGMEKEEKYTQQTKHTIQYTYTYKERTAMTMTRDATFWCHFKCTSKHLYVISHFHFLFHMCMNWWFAFVSRSFQ